MLKKTTQQKLFLLWAFLFLVFKGYSQCTLPFTVPTDNNTWGNWTKTTYDGNWLQNTSGIGYYSTPVRTVNPPTTYDGFGVNDYASDSNFTGIAPQSSSPIIRVGRKFNLPGQATLSPVRKADVATFSFIPTATNCKIKVYYIGMLQESNNLNANYYATVATNYRRYAAHTPASFGINCRYDFTSNIPLTASTSVAGRTEFGVTNFTPPATFTSNVVDQNYGLNDMLSFYQAGTQMKTMPLSTTGDIIKKMNAWDSYVMDFSEFIGQSVTVTLYANTSNYIGVAQNYSYCYYQFECVNDTPTVLPQSNLIDIPDTNLGCVTGLPQSLIVNITNTPPTLLSNLNNATQVNDNTPHRWLRLEDVPGEQYSSNFAGLKILLQDSAGNWNPYSNLSHSASPTAIYDDVNLKVDGAPTQVIPATSTSAEITIFRFKAIYKTRNNPTPQEDFFEVRMSLKQPTPCTSPSTGTISINPTNALEQYNADYLICKPTSSNTGVTVFNINLGPSDCSNIPTANDPSSFSTYKWQCRRSDGTSWADIAGGTTQNLTNAQNAVYYDCCYTQFRRLNISKIPCADGSYVFASVASLQTIIVWNKGFIPFGTNSTVQVTDWVTNTVKATTTNVPLGNNNNPINICYGDSINFNGTLSLGNFSSNGCNGPNLPVSGTNHVNAQFILNYVPGSTDPLNNIVLQTVNSDYTGYSASFPISFNYTALNGNGFIYNGATPGAYLYLTLVITTTYNGCTSSTRVPYYTRIAIYPRSIGGAILVPTCPLMIQNNPAVLTMAYNPATALTAYDWMYCTNYTQTTPGNYTCNSSWQLLYAADAVDLPLWIPAVLGIPRPYIVKRVARAGVNCGASEDSNSVEVVSPQGLATPNFTLPGALCKTAVTTYYPMPVASPAVSGSWYTITSVNPPAISTNPVTSINLATAGTFSFIFIPNNPSSNNGVCYDFVKWTVTVGTAFTPTFNPIGPYCAGTAFTLPATSSNGIAGSWTPAVNNTATTTYTFTPNISCATPKTVTVTILPAPNPGSLSGNQTLTAGTTTTLTPTVTGGTWASSNTAIATVSSNGMVTGINTGTAIISYTVTETNGCTATAVIAITVQQLNTSCTATTIWNGASWSNGVPNTPAYLNTAVVFNGSFNTTQGLYACTVLVTNNAYVTVEHVGSANGHTITVSNQVVVDTGATFDFKDDSSLVQINDVANIGNIIYRRATPFINKFDYTYWSSPVDGQILGGTNGFSPDTPSDRFYYWNPSINNWNNVANTTVMDIAKGYIIRGPSLSTFTNGVDIFKGKFIGVPNNGTKYITVYNAASKMNLIGNPYPSALDVDCFLSDPDNAGLGGAVYLWAHNIPIDFTGATQQGTPGSALYNYNISSYAAYNRLGGVGTGINSFTNNEISTDRPLGKIAAGQSFFIEANNTGTAIFKNSMRVGSQSQQNSQFFRSSPLPAENSSCITEERHRLWLHLKNITSTTQFKQTLVGYSPLATTRATLDRDFDAKTFMIEPYSINLYSLSPANEKLTIQGHQLTAPFDTSDVIPLGFTAKLFSAGPDTIEIGVSEFDGLFNTANFYLRIAQPGGGYVYHDIKASPYQFSITGNVIDDISRFAIVFDVPPGATMVKNIIQDSKFMVIMSPNPFDKGFTLQLQSPVKDIVTVTVFDVLGKRISSEDFNPEELQNHVFGTGLSSGVYQAVITQKEFTQTTKIIKN